MKGYLHNAFLVSVFVAALFTLLIGVPLLVSGNFTAGGTMLAFSMLFFWLTTRENKTRGQPNSSTSSKSSEPTEEFVDGLERAISTQEFTEKKEKAGLNGRKSWTSDLDEMDGYEFEKFVAELFEEMGYETEVTPQSNDQGVDVIAETPFETLAIQAKNYSKSVSNSAVQEIVAAKNPTGADKAIVVATSGFTRSAKSLAQANGVRLVNREELLSMVGEYM